MTNVKIVTDSGCDLPLDLIKELNIEAIPARVNFQNESFLDYDLPRNDFYQRLINGEMPTTGVPAPKQFKLAFERALDESDDVIVFTVSRKLSGIYSTAQMIANQFFKDNLTIIDTQTATLEMGLIVYLAAKKASNGCSKEELLKYLHHEILPNSNLIGFVDSLKHLRKGGRVGTIAWLLGSLLSYKPLIHFKDGVLDSPGKVRGKEQVINVLGNFAKKFVETRKSETVIVGHANDLENAKVLADILDDLPDPPEEIQIHEIGSVIGTHTGPGALGYAWIGDFQKQWLNE
ncbi:MAG: DegV family protein [Candidatus Heimdallarchaeota archaeon]